MGELNHWTEDATEEKKQRIEDSWKQFKEHLSGW